MAKRGFCCRCAEHRLLTRGVCASCLARGKPSPLIGYRHNESRHGAEQRAPRVEKYRRQVAACGRIVKWLAPLNAD